MGEAKSLKKERRRVGNEAAGCTEGGSEEVGGGQRVKTAQAGKCQEQSKWRVNITSQ